MIAIDSSKPASDSHKEKIAKKRMWLNATLAQLTAAQLKLLRRDTADCPSCCCVTVRSNYGVENDSH